MLILTTETGKWQVRSPPQVEVQAGDRASAALRCGCAEAAGTASTASASPAALGALVPVRRKAACSASARRWWPGTRPASECPTVAPAPPEESGRAPPDQQICPAS